MVGRVGSGCLVVVIVSMETLEGRTLPVTELGMAMDLGAWKPGLL